MRPPDNYITGANIITVAQGANLLADKVVSKVPRNIRYRRFYNSLNRATSTGLLKTLSNRKNIDAGEFFVWARAKYGWDCSYYIKKIRVSVSVTVTGVSAFGTAGIDATANSLPSNRRAAEKEAFRRMHEAELNERELVRLRKKLETIEKQRAERSKRAREAGSQGGRGKAR